MFDLECYGQKGQLYAPFVTVLEEIFVVMNNTYLFIDEHILVVDKPSGVLSVPGRRPEHKDSVALRAEADFGETHIVHRLDMETSGIMILARNKEALRRLSKQFQARSVGKYYEALVAGLIDEDQGVVDLPLRCDWPNRPRQMVDFFRGKRALTHWRTLKRDKGFTRVGLVPVTGRSHQLRVHMLSLGHAILGDGLYADGKAKAASDRLQLHACQLDIQHPATHQLVSFTSVAPF